MRTRIRPGIVGAAGVPWTPLSDLNIFGGFYYDSNSLTSGAISQWDSIEGFTHSITQATPTSKPTKDATGAFFDGGDSLSRAATTGNLAKFINRTAVPDDATTAAGLTPGVGGVMCGLARVPGTINEFWGLTYGPSGYQGSPGDATRNPSFIRFRYSGGVCTKLQEITLIDLYPTISGCQGMCVDPDDGSLWGAVAEGAMAGQAIHVSTSGQVLTSGMQASWPISGIAIQPGSPKKMWFAEEAASGNNVESRSMVDNSVINAAVSTGLSNQDIFFYDPTTKCLLLTYGANNTACKIRVYNTNGTSGAIVTYGDIQCPAEVDAIEGVVWEGRKAYFVCDRNYHVSSLVPNAFIECEMVPPVSTKLSIHMTATVSATTGTDCYIEIGTPLAGNGFGVYPTSTTGINVFVNSGASGSAQQGSIVATGLVTQTTPRMIDIYIDTENDTGTLWIDGTQVQTSANMANVVNAITNSQTLRVGTASDVRPITGSIKDIIVVPNQTNRQKMEGYRAWRWGLTANLPANHPYKNVAP
jgi:hypothetical protein